MSDCPECRRLTELVLAQRIAEELAVTVAEQTVRDAWAQEWLAPVEQHLHRRAQGTAS